jgi:hypothetical protein
MKQFFFGSKYSKRLTLLLLGFIVMAMTFPMMQLYHLGKVTSLGEIWIYIFAFMSFLTLEMLGREKKIQAQEELDSIFE